MGAMPNEPSMEEILSSIKRIIAEEDLTSAAPRAPRKAAAPAGTINGDALNGTDADAADDQILELTDALPGEVEKPMKQEAPIMSAPAKPAPVNSAPQIKPEAKPARAEPKAPRARAAAAAAAPTPSTAHPPGASR